MTVCLSLCVQNDHLLISHSSGGQIVSATGFWLSANKTPCHNELISASCHTVTERFQGHDLFTCEKPLAVVAT